MSSSQTFIWKNNLSTRSQNPFLHLHLGPYHKSSVIVCISPFGAHISRVWLLSPEGYTSPWLSLVQGSCTRTTYHKVWMPVAEVSCCYLKFFLKLKLSWQIWLIWLIFLPNLPNSVKIKNPLNVLQFFNFNILFYFEMS